MGILDRLLGREERDRTEGQPGWAAGAPAAGAPAGTGAAAGPGRSEDEVAVERYRYLLRTAPPDQVEQAHAEAFAKLTPEQRRQVLEQLGAAVPASERAQTDDPQALARMATRAEVREPGTMERVLGRGGGMGGMGMGGLIAGSLLASVAGAFVGTAIADAMFDMSDNGGEASSDGGDSGGGEAGGGEAGGGGDYGGDVGGDVGGGFDGGGFDGGGFGEF